jgi:hypothetical protein
MSSQYFSAEKELTVKINEFLVKKSPYVSLPVELSKSTVKKIYRLNQNSLSSFCPPKEVMV